MFNAFAAITFQFLPGFGIASSNYNYTIAFREFGKDKKTRDSKFENESENEVKTKRETLSV